MNGKEILVAVDGSDGADRALDFAADLARRGGQRLVILHVAGGYGLPARAMRAMTHVQHGWFDEMIAEYSAEILKEARDRAIAAGAEPPRLESRGGDVVATILEFAREHGVELIVMGRRGAGHFVGLPLGSVSRAVASLAPVPAVVVP